MAADIAITNARIATPDGVLGGAVLITDGVISGILQGREVPEATEVIDAGGDTLLPGVVDIHVHFREPGQEYKATYASESAAAAVGGVTTICDMPNNGDRAIIDPARFAAKHAVAKRSSRVDFGIYAYLVSSDADELAALVAAGVMGFKWDMSLAGAEPGPDRFLPHPDMAEPYLRAVAATGARLGIHAEDRALVLARTAALRAEGRLDARAHLEARPVEAEVIALRQAIELVRRTGVQMHVHHLSSAAGLELVRAAKREGLPVSAETIPAFLFLDDSDYERLGTLIKIHPSVKYAEDRAALWEGLRDGSIDCLATDHAPHTREEKLRDIWQASPGAIGVQTSLPLMLDAVARGLLGLERCVEAMAAAPARLYGLAPRKGTIVVGADADLVLVSLGTRMEIRNEAMCSPNRLTPFDGRVVQGVPRLTLLRGMVIARDGAAVGDPHGQLVTPTRL